MIFLLKPHQYSKHMRPVEVTSEWWKNLVENPPVIKHKDRAPLAIYGTLAQQPELDGESGMPRCTGDNVYSLYAFQLDFDSGLPIEQFCQRYSEYQWTLYTSYSYGYKPGDRYRICLPLEQPFPCELLQNSRVHKNLVWNFQGVDVCCFDRGHFQILPCIREHGAPYRYIQNKGRPWSFDLDGYWSWKREDDAMFAERAARAREMAKEVDVVALIAELENELREVPVGSGVRYAEAKRLLAKYAHKGAGDALLGLECPWDDKKWQRQWPSLVAWASTIQ